MDFLTLEDGTDRLSGNVCHQCVIIYSLYNNNLFPAFFLDCLTLENGTDSLA